MKLNRRSKSEQSNLYQDPEYKLCILNKHLTNVPIMVHYKQMNKMPQLLNVKFFRTKTGNEPVRLWLKDLSYGHKKTIGEDIKTVQYGWPLGMPLVEKLGPGLWEVRSRVQDGISRVLFTVEGSLMILLHGFIKKSQKIPLKELKIAKDRLKQYMEGDR